MISNMICSNCDYAGRPTYDYPCSACDMTKGSPLCMWELKEKQTNVIKLQYRCVDIGKLKYRIFLYHDGEFVEKRDVWIDELEEETDRLEAQGYSYGYTKEEVEDARELYESKLSRIIRGNEYEMVN